jgi:hypothetical protein
VYSGGTEGQLQNRAIQLRSVALKLDAVNLDVEIPMRMQEQEQEQEQEQGRGRARKF